MTSRYRRCSPAISCVWRVGLCGFFVLGLATAAKAQCPDGSPPPCARRVAVDTNAFIVRPFTVRGEQSAQYLGASMVDLLHMALDGVGKMRIEYAPTNLRRLSELSGPEDARGAAGVALELGAGRVIGGTIVALGSDVRIRAEVLDAVRGRTQFVVEGRANINNLAAVVDSLASQILARRLLLPGERRRLSIGEYATKSPKALQLYLVARQHVRRGERAAAADSLKIALRHDPDFGLVHLLLHRLESAQGGITLISIDSINRFARARKSRFPERVQFMFDDARVSGNRFHRLGWAQATAQRFPNDPDAAFYLADALFHYGLNLGESRDVAVAAFRRAIALDDADPELLQHFSTLMDEVGDSTESRTAWQRCRAIAPSLCAGDLGFRVLYQREDPIALAVGADSLLWGGPANWMLRGIAWDPALGLAITDSFARIQTAPSRSAGLRSAAFVVRSTVALARGQYDLAQSFLDSAAARGSPGGFHMLHHIVTGTPTAEASAATVNPTGLTSVVIRAWWAAATQTPDSAEKYVRILETGTWPDADKPTAEAAAAGLRGLVALRAGDTARALGLLTSMRPMNIRRPVPLRVLYPNTPLALLHAQIEAARGNHSRAKLYLADVYPINDYVPFIGDAEELRARVALALGDTASAKVALQKVVEVWANADPPLQPRVAAARATLPRLRNP
jgi:tetratricopeptide (TPR) repeat protein